MLPILVTYVFAATPEPWMSWFTAICPAPVETLSVVPLIEPVKVETKVGVCPGCSETPVSAVPVCNAGATVSVFVETALSYSSRRNLPVFLTSTGSLPMNFLNAVPICSRLRFASVVLRPTVCGPVVTLDAWSVCGSTKPSTPLRSNVELPELAVFPA